MDAPSPRATDGERARWTARRLRRVWRRALLACALYLGVALVLPRLVRGARPGRERPRRQEAPVYVTPSGERRRAAVFVPADAAPADDHRGDRALLWWSGLLSVVTLAGAAAQTRRIRAEADADARTG